MKLRRNLFRSWAYSAQTVRPPPKLTHGNHIFGMSTRPRNDSYCPKLCRLSCSRITKTPSKLPILAVLGLVKFPTHSEIFHWCTHADIDSRLLFQKRSKCVQVKWPKVRVVLVTKTKHVLQSLDATHWAISPKSICVSAHHDSSFTFWVSSRSVQVWGDITAKPLQEPQSECNYLFQPIIICNRTVDQSVYIAYISFCRPQYVYNLPCTEEL